MRFQLDDLAKVVGGELVGVSVVVVGLSSDSRLIGDGGLFVALQAERDGHDFVGAARSNGASAYLGTRRVDDGPAVLVTDANSALVTIGRMARERLKASAADRVIGITGSVGKTSVKDLTAAALRTHYPLVAASERSFNNEIGLPLTLANAPDGAQAVVVEMGMRGFGQIAALCEIARPNIGVITNIGVAHGEFVGGPDGIAKAKSELVEALPHNGFAIVPAGDTYIGYLRQRTKAAVVTFGAMQGDVRVSDVRLDEDLRPTFLLDSPWGSAEVTLAMSGAHMAINAAAAVATVGVAGVPFDAAVHGVSTASLSPWRMEVRRSPDGALIINDAYNANPVSMAAALHSLAAAPATRRVAIVGLMAELGGDPAQAHLEIAALATSLDIELIVVGCDWYGVAPKSNPLEALGTLDANAAVLVKASRSVGLEKIAAQLLDPERAV